MKLPLAFLTARYTRAEIILEQSIYRMERTTVENKLRAGWKLHPAQHTLWSIVGVWLWLSRLNLLEKCRRWVPFLQSRFRR